MELAAQGVPMGRLLGGLPERALEAPERLAFDATGRGNELPALLTHLVGPLRHLRDTVRFEALVLPLGLLGWIVRKDRIDSCDERARDESSHDKDSNDDGFHDHTSSELGV